MDITRKIKMLLIEYDMTATTLAEKIGMSQSNLSKKMKNQTYTVADIEDISKALGIDYEVSFILKDGKRI